MVKLRHRVVERSEPGSAGPRELCQIRIGHLAVTDDSLGPGNTFHANPDIRGFLATSLAGPPAAVQLTWANQATYPAATEVTIQRATDAAFTSGVTTPPFTTAGTATSYTDSTVTAGSTYYYRVRAENVPGYSPWSDPVSITMP